MHEHVDRAPAAVAADRYALFEKLLEILSNAAHQLWRAQFVRSSWDPGFRISRRPQAAWQGYWLQREPQLKG
jgi:hypothetical protein